MNVPMTAREAIRTILAVVLLLGFGCGPGEELAPISQAGRDIVELTARVDKAVVNPGDIITFTLNANYDPDVSLEFPQIAEKLSDFRIAKSGISGPLQEGDRLIIEQWYKLQADSSGSYVIDSIEVPYAYPDGQRETARTPKIFLEVESLLAKQKDVQDIRDIKPPVSVTPSLQMPLLIVALMIAAIVAVILLLKMIRRFRTKAVAERLVPRPAHEEALEALENLLRQRLIEKGRIREFCFQISEIFRHYMQARFAIPAIDLTTEEILPRVEEDGIIDKSLHPVVREFLLTTDLVKFARYQPPRTEIHGIIEQTRRFITATSSGGASASETQSARGGETQ